MALSAMLFFSCSKDDTVTKGLEKVKITLSADKDGIASKTAAIEGETSFSYIWTDEDVTNMKLYTVSGGNVTEVTNKTVTKVSDKNLTITTEVESGKSYTFRAILSNPDHSSVQQPNGTTSFDPEADVYVSDDLNVNVAADGNTTTDLNLKFNHKVVGNKMTLKNMTAGEKVSKVVITSDNDLTGHLVDGSMVGDGNKITLTYNNVEVPEGGQFPVYFISMANSGQKLTIDVTTDQNVYTKKFTKNIDLVLGQFTRFGVKLPATATINFGTGNTVIDNANFTCTDSKNNNWSITTSWPWSQQTYTYGSGYSQIGDDDNVANSITFSATLPSTTIKKITVKMRGTEQETEGEIALKVGNTTVGSGSLWGFTERTIESTTELSGTVPTIAVTEIKNGGVKVHSITIIYE